MNDKITKLLAVVCLTLLIWTWAFLSQEDQKTFSGTLVVAPSTDRQFLVSFWYDGENLGQTVNLEVTFRGTPAKITDLSRQTEMATPDNPQRNPLTYYYNPRDENHTQSQVYPFNLKEFLQQQSHLKGLALTLESCSINQETVSQIEVRVEVLEKKLVPVECMSENGLPVPGAVTEPGQVEMYVRENYNGPAYVILSPQQIDLALQRPIAVKPFVQMTSDLLRRSQQEVTVTILKETVNLQARVLQPFEPPRRIGYILSENLTGKYRVEMDPESESELRTIHLRATDEAWEAYSRMRYPILIEIRDENVQNMSQEIIYNLPREYVAHREIELGGVRQPPQTATIRLIPITPEAPTP